MKQIHYVLWILFFFSCEENKQIYRVADTPWKEHMGNHRAIIQVQENATAAYLDLEWRRHDKNPEKRRFIVVSQLGDTVSNILRKEVNNERCRIVFGPVRKGKYYFYYLPFQNQEGHGSYTKDYYPKERAADKLWQKQVPDDYKELPQVICIAIESRTAFDSFYPMEVIALDTEKEEYQKRNDKEYLVFVEDRKHPIRMTDNIPEKWINYTQQASFHGTALRNEYYVFQIGLWASQKDISNITFEFSSINDGNESIPASLFTCFNTDGIDSHGQAFVKRVDVSKGRVQAFWVGIDIPETVKPGNYRGNIIVNTPDAPSQQVPIYLEVEKEVIADRGDSEIWRHSRLRWLNSTAGIDHKTVASYQPIKQLEDGVYDLSGKKLVIDKKGLPATLSVFGTEILNNPISFVIESEKGIEKMSDAYGSKLLENDTGLLSATWQNTSDNFEIFNTGTVESDGYIHIRMKVKAKKNVVVKDIRLEIPYRKEVATHMMGMGLPGQATPSRHHAKWKGPQDSFWIGSAKGGLHCELRGAEYAGPLLNLYKPAPPVSWHNEGRGGFKIVSKRDEIKAISYSGKREFRLGDEVEFEFALIITPVKKLDTKAQFTNRYYHNYKDPWPQKEELEAKTKIINVHHANKYNPHINYPFVAVKEMKNFVNHWHNEGMKVKLYYTVRELTNYATEIWALRSLGDEILGQGKGGGYPWLREHFVEDYYPQWYDKIDSVTVDASILTSTGDSRWFNYYIEGLKWLVENLDIDGLYLDDVSYDRHMLKRMRKVMDSAKPGCLIDLHSNTGFSRGPAIQYAEFFPYLDKLWFGESFFYDEMSPENWLVEVSGIPFGHMGDMLHRGGNPWRGMVYGMTVRHPWVTDGVMCDPRAIWKQWDDFGIADAEMIGYWEDSPLVTADNPSIKATAYVKDNKLMIAVASWAEKTVKVKLHIDWDRIGINPAGKKMRAPEIENYQPEAVFLLDQSITIDPIKGWLFVVE